MIRFIIGILMVMSTPGLVDNPDNSIMIIGLITGLLGCAVASSGASVIIAQYEEELL